MSRRVLQGACFRLGEFGPGVGFEGAQGDGADACSADGLDVVAECRTHPPDLAIEPFGQDESEGAWSRSKQSAWARHAFLELDAFLHPANEPVVEGFVDPYLVFAFMSEFGAEEAVDECAVIGQKDEP